MTEHSNLGQNGTVSLTPPRRDMPVSALQVDVQFEKKLKKPVTLATLRAHAAKLKGMLLLAPGSRLSVTPVRPEHWDYVLDLAGE